MGVWKIEELPTGEVGATGETFAWGAALAMPTPFGGARAAPRGGAWTFGGTQRSKRTDYPGATTPSVQVLGPVTKPQNIEGVFEDRHNFPGYARGEQRRLEDMLKRGNLCRVSFDDHAFVGLFVDWDFVYRGNWQCGYSLQFDVHARAEDYDISDRSSEPELANIALYDALDVAVASALEFAGRAPRVAIADAAATNVDARLSQLATVQDQLGLSLHNHDIVPPESPVDGFTHLASRFRAVQGAAYEVMLELAGVRSDALAVQTAMDVLNFEDWSRSVRFAARIAMGRARRGDRACSARAAPDAKRLYRPSQGESLYAIARKFYGEPHAWRLIYDRNHLTSATLTGDELLIIPEM